MPRTPHKQTSKSFASLSFVITKKMICAWSHDDMSSYFHFLFFQNLFSISVMVMYIYLCILKQILVWFGRLKNSVHMIKHDRECHYQEDQCLFHICAMAVWRFPFSNHIFSGFSVRAQEYTHTMYLWYILVI